MDFHVFLSALASSAYMKGAFISVSLATLVEVVGIAIGFALALARLSQLASVRSLVIGYVWLFRAVPALLILLVVWNALPEAMPVFRESWFTPYMGALVGLALYESALETEIIRSAIGAIPRGQVRAARAIGLSGWQVYRHVLVPQIIKIVTPVVGNQYINMVKMTSLASVISLQELLYVSQQSVSLTFSYVEYYLAAVVYYLVIVSILMIGQHAVERSFTWSSGVAG